MDHPTNWSSSIARSSDLSGSLLLTSAGLLLVGVWSALWFARTPLSSQFEWKEWHPVALEEFRDACEAGDAIACNDLGVCYERGYGTSPNPWKAVELFERGCRRGSAEACNNQGAMIERSWGSERAIREVDAVRALYKRACDHGSALGCSNLGALYAKGKGVRQDTSDARWLFERACQTGCATGCTNLIALYALTRSTL